MLVFISGEFQTNLAGLSRLFATNADRRFKFQKRRQLSSQRIQSRSRIQFATEFAKTFAMPFGHKASR